MDIEKSIESNIENAETNQQKNDATIFDSAAYKIQKPLFEIDKKDIVFAVFAMLSCIFTAVFGIFSGFQFGYMLSLFITMTVMSIYLANRQGAGVIPILCGVLAVLNFVVFITTSNCSVRFFAVIITLLLCLVFFDGLVNKDRKGNRAVLNIFCSAASSMGNIDVSMKSLFLNGGGKKKTVGKAIIGIICAIPVLIIILPLLISSDDAFKGLIQSVFSSFFNTVLKEILGMGLSVFVISYGLSLKKNGMSQLKQHGFVGIENVYVISFLCAISVCYLLYLFSQFAYFFSAFSGILPDGYEFNVSHYARKGFFEMCIIAVINLSVVSLGMFLSKKTDGKVCGGVKSLCTFISVFTLLIIATAISKMVLYINSFGMTVLRITTSSFMLFLAVVFISVILRVYIRKINILKTSLIAAGCIVLILGVANVNAVVARHNYNMYISGKLSSIDVNALYCLGDEGIPYITKLAYSKDSDVSQKAQEYLSQAYLYDYFENIESAQSFNVEELKQNRKQKGFENFTIPKNKAYESLYEFIENNPDFSVVYPDWEEDFAW